MLTRKMDKLRRIVIPLEFFKKLKLKKNQDMEITIEFGYICIRAFDNTEDVDKKPYIGIVRCIDEFNRIVIPTEYLRVLSFKENNLFIMELNGETIKIYPKKHGAFI